MNELYLWQCPHCRREHGLCWLATKSGTDVKKVLGVNCDDSFRVHHTRFVRIPQAILDVSDIDEKRLELIPVFWTGPAKQREAATQNYGLTLMLVQPGQTVERNVDLPRGPQEPTADEQEAVRLQSEIAQRIQAQAELTRQIEKLARQRIALEGEERELREKLRAVWNPAP